MTDEEKLKRADQARQVLDNPAFKETAAALDRRLLLLWESTDILETDVREAVWMQRKSLRDFFTNLETTFKEGGQAKLRINNRTIDR